MYVSLPIFLFVLVVVLFLIYCEGREIAVGRCPRCKTDLAKSGDFSFRRPRWCPKCRFLVRPEDLEGMLDKWAKDREMVTLIVEADPNTKWLSMSLLLAFKRRVDWLVIEPIEDDYRHYFIESGEIQEDEPPTRHMHRAIAAAARAIWKGDPYDDTPFESTQQVTLGKFSAHVTLTVTPTPAGEVLRFQFSYPDENSAETPIPQSAAMV